MEIIRKTIYLDESKSHRPGLLPYIAFDSEEEITFVDTGNTNGNYGGFVCDICSVSAYTDENQVAMSAITGVVRYLDIMRRYNAIQDIISKGICLSGGTFSKESKGCWDIVGEDDNTEVRYYPLSNFTFTDYCDENNTSNSIFSRYSYSPKDVFKFTEVGGYYVENAEEEDESNGEVSEVIAEAEVDLGPIILLENFEVLEECKTWWLNICEEFQLPSSWYIMPDGINEYFSLCYAVEKYFLGLIEVLNEFENETPNFVYYSDLINIKDRYGDDFKAYIESESSAITNIGDVFISGTSFFTIPTVDIPILLLDDSVTEKTYTPYVYSLSGTDFTTIKLGEDVVSAINGTIVTEYIANRNNSVERFEVLSATGIYVESKLESLKSFNSYPITEDMNGLFDDFTYLLTSGNTISGVSGSCLFKCTYKETNVTVESGVTPVSPQIVCNNTLRIIPPTGKNDFIINSNVITETSSITYSYGWWECSMITDASKLLEYTSSYGDIVNFGEKEYANVTLLSCVNSIIANPTNGTICYLMARFDNGYIGESGNTYYLNNSDNIANNMVQLSVKAMKLPYDVGIPKDIRTHIVNGEKEYSCNIITNINYGASSTTIDYVLGADYFIEDDIENVITENKGIHYKEVLSYNNSQPNGIISNTFLIDGYYVGDIFLHDVNMSTNSIDYEKTEYGLTREVKVAQIVGMEVGNVQWDDYLLITKEGTENLMNQPKYDINLVFNRGAGAAWEGHFKLSECNTMEDLENYGNNYFNI